MEKSLRVYETDTPQHKLYSDMHRNQTLDYVLDKKEKYSSLNNKKNVYERSISSIRYIC